MQRSLVARLLSLTGRAALAVAEKIVPASGREEWAREWRGPLLGWMLDAADQGVADSRLALGNHVRSALADASRRRVASDLGGPAFCLGVGAVLLLAVAIGTHGFALTRLAASPLRFPDPDNVVMLSQGPPTLGVRLGFLEKELALFRGESKTVKSLATYTWYQTEIATERGTRAVTAAKVSPEFFDVLQVAPALGMSVSKQGFVANYDYWRGVLKSASLGHEAVIGGQTLRLAGVMPEGFRFLAAPIEVWLPAGKDPSVVDRRWWLGLKGTIGRRVRGAAEGQIEQELRGILREAGVSRKDWQVHAVAVTTAMYQDPQMDAWMFAIPMTGYLLWALASFWFDRRRKHALREALRYWGFFYLKGALPMTALFGFVYENAGVNRLGLTGGIWWARDLLLGWMLFCGVGLILAWARRDQKRRCRECLQRLKQPLRIGVPGQMLLETSGEEVLCPKGHGSLYTSESILGQEMSDRWMGV